MKVFQVIGYKKTGKTHLIKNILSSLAVNNKIVVLKNTHNKNIQNKKTDSEILYNKAAEEVILQTPEDSYIKRPNKPLIKLLKEYKENNYDYFIIEGLKNINLPRIICNAENKQLEKNFYRNVVAVCNLIKNNKKTFTFDKKDNFNEVLNNIKKLPDFPVGLNCKKCGKSCINYYNDKFNNKNIKCVMQNSNNLEIKINNKKLPLAPFVENLVKNTIIGLIKNLKGYESGKIEIEINNKE
ncbi:MAG: hypothetical protein FXF47_04330 [Candidatus Mcinerneyibacterium aminivorans]|uniref:Molybdopterin-guanine dinucleotide biosynthesis protein B (MobB) domain-containing protein n=1 Tax=Candidatus Mcinerneyibacterium aminivorans TaxID=2703815 RepID=A0A5D0MCB5_9BACT|nr:MAG: hypothetical protein FXF47_04330 [Candidatus Mcinerneyibacterium aminivorans]